MYFKRYLKFFIAGAIILLMICVFAVTAIAKPNTNAETKRAVPFSEVNVDGGLLHDYMKLTICNVIPTAIENVEKPNGGINNIKNCAKWHKGEIERPDHEGALYVDSDVHKVLESMCMALDTPSGGDPAIEAAQAKIKEKLEEWIPYYQWAPEQDGSQYPGYFDSYWSLDPGHEKYSNTDQHELYCQGHFIEAAVAHYRYTQSKEEKVDTRLFDVAIKSADHISKTFGTDPGQRKQIPGHEEIELSLMKLAKLCNEIGGEYSAKAENYVKTAAFFLEVRGDYEGRTVDDTQGKKREYYQDHLPVAQQTSAVGHAVRAQYLYTGMCELATINPDYAKKYDNALNSLWEDVTHRKQYVTGGIGDQSNSNEGFAGPYYLPNYTSYCETCAGVANMLWNRAMSTLYDGAKYADQIETDLYNNVLGCINFDGNKFYYQNRLCTIDAFDRSSWFGTACCPPNFTRTILQLGGYVYNTTSNDVFINQYISNNANFEFGTNKVNFNMKSNFPYDSTAVINVTPKENGTFSVQLRKPSWSNNYSIKVNGTAITPQEKDGYIVISGQEWTTAGSKIEINFDMPLKYVKTDDRVETNQGLLALRHGPLFYCAEGCDNDANFNFNKALIDQNGNYSFEYVASLDGKDNPFGVRSVYVLNHDGKLINGTGTSNINWKFIPYYARCNRTLSGMHVFVHDGQQAIKTHQRAIPSASFTSIYDTVDGLNDGTNDKDMRWTSYKSDTDVLQNPWVQYDFKTPVSFNGFRIWWYDDNGGVRMPDKFTFTVYDSQNNSYKEINQDEINVISNNDDKYKTYTFPEIYTGNTIRMTIENEKSAHAVGIVEWELIDAEEPQTLSDIKITKQPTKTEYLVNENFDPSGMIVEAKYTTQSGKETSKEITGYTYAPVKLEKIGQQEVTISYTEGDITKTDKLTVNVKDSVTPSPEPPSPQPLNPDTVNPSSADTVTNTDNTTPPTSDNIAAYLLPIAVLIVAGLAYFTLRNRNKKHTM